MLPRRLENALWSLAYGRWPRVRAHDDDRQGGWSLLLTVPPDLPVFLHLAVSMCRQQDLAGHVETIVVPDRFDRAFRAHVAAAARSWPEGRLRLVEPPWRDRLLRPLLRKPSTIHWLQLVAAAGAARGAHAVLHDVDLFMLDRGYLRSLVATCRDRGLAAVGNAAPWEGAPWTKLPACAHVVALWELCFDVAWLRDEPPAALRPQFGAVAGGTFWFETSLLRQARTEPHRIARHRDADVVHFGWVVGGYRTFQRALGPFEDDQFRLLLIRLLADAFDPAGRYRELPAHADLVAGIGARGRRVVYGDACARSYGRFRAELERLLQSDALPAGPRAAMRDGLRPFDGAFGSPVAAADAVGTA